MGKLTGSNSIEGRMPNAMTAKRNAARVGPEVSDNSMDRVQQEGDAFFARGAGFIPSSVNGRRDGDESLDAPNLLGGNTGSWQMKLDQGSDSPYPETAESLKIKNTRRNNDGFFPG